ncbi:prepilin-type N-terminal cleavage/methylation domain-containing protein [Patescibacteria group bacterium]
MKKPVTQKGFTLVEFIIYVAIASFVLISTVNVSWNIMSAQANFNAKQEVYINSRLAMNQVGIVIKEAEDVLTAQSVFDSHPGVLTLDYPGVNDVIIDTYIKNISVGGQSAAIRKLQIKGIDGSFTDLTTDKVNVTNFKLTNLTRGSEKDNINMELRIEKINPGDDPTYDASIEFETAISLRE